VHRLEVMAKIDLKRNIGFYRNYLLTVVTIVVALVANNKDIYIHDFLNMI
jgi:hypothetical protein